MTVFALLDRRDRMHLAPIAHHQHRLSAVALLIRVDQNVHQSAFLNRQNDLLVGDTARGFLRVACVLVLADNLVVLRMRTDPEPLDAAWHIMREGPVSLADTDGPHITDALEMKRWMPRVGLEQFEVLVGGRANFWRKRVIESPKMRRRLVLQSGRLLPALCSARDFSMR